MNENAHNMRHSYIQGVIHYLKNGRVRIIELSEIINHNS